MPKNKPPSSIGTDIVKAGAAASFAVAAGGSPGLVVGAALAPLLASRAFDWTRDLFSSREKTYWSNLADALGDDAASVRETIEKDLPDEALKGVVIDAMRSLLLTVDSAVVPPIAALSAEYIKSGTRVDGFFRGLSRVLTDLTAEEFEELRMLLAGLARVPAEPNWAFHDALLHVRAMASETEVGVVWIKGNSMMESAVSELGPHTTRSFHVLKLNGFAHEESSAHPSCSAAWSNP